MPGSSGITVEGVTIEVLRRQAGGLQDGDIVVGVDGRLLESWTESLFERGIPPSRSDGQTLHYHVKRNGQLLEIPVLLGPYPLGEVFRRNWGTIIFGLAFLMVGGFVFIRRPESSAGKILFLFTAGIAGSTAWSFGLTVGDFMDGTGFWLFKIATFFFYNLAWTAGLHFALLFPKPFNILKKSWFLPSIYLGPFIAEGFYLTYARSVSSGNLDWFSRWAPIEGLHAAVFLFCTIIIFFFQFRRASEQTDRMQIRWVVLAGILTGGVGLAVYILPPFLGLQAVTPNLIGILMLTYPIALAIAILRHNIFNIDTIINRTLVYGALTAGTMFFYVAVVGFAGGLIQTERQGLLAFLTTGIVALVFQPLRDWLQTAVNRFMYGDRDDPYSVLNALGRRLQNTLAPHEVIPAIVETVAEALKLPYAGITLKDGNTFAYGVPPGRIKPSLFPLAYQGETFGRLEIAQRAVDEPLTDKEIKLINDLARQIEVAVHDVRLNQDLQRSRQRLVTAREEERRRIRRDLHDGLGPQLASQMLTLEAMDKLIESNPEAARTLLRILKSQSQNAIEEIRDLIYGLRPPALDDLGLEEALRQEIGKFPKPPVITMDTPEQLPQLPAAVELAIYRIVQEAVNNVVKHANAERCIVKVNLDSSQLQVTVEDNGCGLPEFLRTGIGLQAMRERAEELGGRFEISGLPDKGVIVRAYLPLSEELND